MDNPETEKNTLKDGVNKQIREKLVCPTKDGEEPSEPKTETRKVEKVTTGRVTKRKKGLGRKIIESFVGDESKSVGDYILHDVLIPATKDTIADMIKGTIEMMFWGEKRGRYTSRDGGRSRVNYTPYNSLNNRDRDRGGRREMSREGRARHDFEELVFASRGEAEEVLSLLFELTEKYGMATVADFYDLAGITADFTDDKYGWDDLRNASVSRVRDGYLINLPRTIALN